MEICLHVGAHRTATTSFQAYMNGLGDQLNLGFWGPKKTRSGLMAGLIKNTDRLTGDDHALGQRSVGRMRIGLQSAEEAGKSHMVISEENLIGAMNHSLKTGKLYAQAGARLSRFAEAFQGRHLRVGLGIRSYDSYWASVLGFNIKMGRSAPCEARLRQLSSQTRRWRDVVEDIARALPDARIAVWSFETAAYRPDQQLAALLGRPAPALNGTAPWCNATPKRVKLAAALLERGDWAGAQKLCAGQGRYMPFDPAQVTKMLNDYIEDIAWLQAGADGLASYHAATGDTSGRSTKTEGISNERRQESVG